MKTLKIQIQYGELIMPQGGGHFVDAEQTEVIEIPCLSIEQVDGEELGRRLALAMGDLAGRVEV